MRIKNFLTLINAAQHKDFYPPFFVHSVPLTALKVHRNQRKLVGLSELVSRILTQTKAVRRRKEGNAKI